MSLLSIIPRAIDSKCDVEERNFIPRTSELGIRTANIPQKLRKAQIAKEIKKETIWFLVTEEEKTPTAQ